MRILDWIIRNSSRGQSQRHKKSVNATVPAEASMGMVVRRFTGRYECGCEVDTEILQPDECVTHGQPKVFSEEDHGIQFTERVDAPRELFERGG